MHVLNPHLLCNLFSGSYHHHYKLICTVVDKLASVWRGRSDVLNLQIPENSLEFQNYYNSIQAKISKLSVLDELLAGK